MYTSYYRMTEKPFQISTDPRFLWLGEKHKEALANLKYGLLDRNGFVVLTGDVGTGKTTLVNALLNALGHNVRVAMVNHPHLDANEFLTLVAKTLDPAFEGTHKSSLILFFNTYLRQAYADGKVVLLIIDEAHRLSMDLLEEIRLLSNIEHDGQTLINIMFIGQNEINSMLRRPQCRALRQRVTTFYHIQALSPEETRDYVDYRLHVAGTSERIFTTEALEAIHALSRGNPRLINILCDRALLTGYVEDRHIVNADIILECAHELDLGDTFNEVHRRRAASVFSKTWHGTVDRLANTFKTFWKKPGTALEVATIALHQSVNRSHSAIKAMFAEIKRFFGRLLEKNRRKLLPTALMSGIVMAVIVVTISTMTGVKLQGKASAAKQIDDSLHEMQITAGKTIEERETLHASVSSTSAAQNGNGQAADAPWSDRAPIPAVPESTLLDRASAALGRKDYQAVLDLLEARPIGGADGDADSVGIYARALVGRAGELMAASPEKAEALLMKAIDVSPNMVEPYLLLATRYTHAKDYARAIDAYQQAIELDPSASDAFFNLGYIYAATGEFEAAESAFERVVSLKPSYLGKSLFNLAVVQQKLGKKELSIANLQAAVAMEPDNERALAFLNSLRKSAAGRPAEHVR